MNDLGIGEMSVDQVLKMYSMMLTVRRTDERLAGLFQKGEFGGFLHLSLGQEAVAVGVASHGIPEDYVTMTHRSHGHLLSWGVTLRELVAEVFWRRGGLAEGMAGHVHVGNIQRRIIGGNGVLGQNQPIATGIALSLKERDEPGIVVSIFGDGTGNEGVVSEALNMSAAMGLPVLWICERNDFAQLSPWQTHYPDITFNQRAAGFGIPSTTVDGRDVESVVRAMSEWKDFVRTQRTPALVEVLCDRWEGHYVGDPETYRVSTPQGFVDPLESLVDRYRSVLTGDVVDSLEKEVAEAIDSAVDFSRSSPRVTWDEYLDAVAPTLPTEMRI